MARDLRFQARLRQLRRPAKGTLSAYALGLRTFWVNRLQAPAEELGVTPAAVGSDLNELAHHLS